ncbi:MAG: hypothetical protein JXA73_09140 [Acidobacteria bacterium]|nr:hypothetical protein [Acidobacteriota bacterium]
MRVSEALALRMDDIKSDGLIIRKTKLRKSRLLPASPHSCLGTRTIPYSPQADCRG